VKARLAAVPNGVDDSTDARGERTVFPSLSLFGHVARGDGQFDNFRVPAPPRPLGLPIVAFLVIQLVLLLWRNVMRRRFGRKNPLGPRAADPEEQMFLDEAVRHGA
jgi:hypothetical protein